MPEVPTDVLAQTAKLGTELQRRARGKVERDEYYEGSCPLPQAVRTAKMTKAYRMLMPMAEAPWGSLIVDSVQDRLEVSGLGSDDRDVDKKLWGYWQENGMDAESKLAQNAALLDGRAYALVWPDEDSDGKPAINLDDCSQMIVQYREGSRRARRAALRYWLDDDGTPNATLYRREAIYKLKGPKNSGGFQGTQWEAREVDGEVWPLENPLDRVPVVEIPVNPRLKPGSFPHARGEFAHCTGLIDRINLLTFLGLVVAFYMGFPLRGVIGDRISGRILRDDDGNALIDPETNKPEREDSPPFDVHADSVFQIENPNAKLAEFKAAERKNLSVFAELDQLAVVSKTPRHYFPLEQGMSNISADAIRASEGALHAKVHGHKASIGEGWEEVLRLAGMQFDEPLELSPRAAIEWKDHESRSLAERADAATKLKEILPWQALAERVLNATSDDISRWEGQRASEGLNGLLAAAASTPTTPPAPEEDETEPPPAAA